MFALWQDGEAERLEKPTCLLLRGRVSPHGSMDESASLLDAWVKLEVDLGPPPGRHEGCTFEDLEIYHNMPLENSGKYPFLVLYREDGSRNDSNRKYHLAKRISTELSQIIRC